MSTEDAQAAEKVALTDAEREALYPIVRKSVGAYMVVERIVAARVAEVVDRERAAWAAKVEALADSWTCAPTLAADLRSLLPVDTTPEPSGEGGAPDDVPTIAGSEPATPSPEARCSCGSGATSLNPAEVVVHRHDGSPCYIAQAKS